MFRAACWLLSSFAILIGGVAFSARQQRGSESNTRKILLDVAVTAKNGAPVGGLAQQDFTVLDNKTPQMLTSFQTVDGRNAAIRVILVVDGVNTDYQHVAYERDEIDRFLRAEGGNLAHLTALEVLTDKGMQMSRDFSNDGNALSAALDQYALSLRFIRRGQGVYGGDEQLQISLEGLNSVAASELAQPGRKIVLWVSPGWPLLSGPDIEVDENQHQRLFSDIVRFSTELRQAHITLYSIDPVGTADAGGFNTFFWKEFVKGISKPSQTQPGNLALEVLATQSGGLALNSSNDVAALLEKCVADTAAYYELSFTPPPGNRPNEYHSLEVRVAKPGLTARTRQGYYSQP